MPSLLIAASPQLHTSAMSAFHLDDHPQQAPGLIPDPIGPVIHSQLGALVALNPQPLPPAELGAHANADRVALNPQPLPPRELGRGLLAHIAQLVSLNPQPLPPIAGDRLDAVALNPQPLPPKESFLVRADEYCGNGRFRLPIPPLPGPVGGGDGIR